MSDVGRVYGLNDTLSVSLGSKAGAKNSDRVLSLQYLLDRRIGPFGLLWLLALAFRGLLFLTVFVIYLIPCIGSNSFPGVFPFRSEDKEEQTRYGGSGLPVRASLHSSF